jgi:hypothetical protein
MGDTTCRQCLSHKAEVSAAKKELSDLRRFKAKVKQAFGSDNLGVLHLASEVVERAIAAAEAWEDIDGIDGESLDSLADAVAALRKSQMPPERPEDKAVRENMERKSGAFEGPDELDLINDPHNRGK